MLRLHRQEASGNRPLRVLCNARWFEGRAFRGRPIESTLFRDSGPVSNFRIFFSGRRCDAVVFNVDQRGLFTFCFMRRILGAGRCRLVSVDIHLPPPRTARDRWRARFVGWLLRGVDLFICYFKATRPLCQAYGLEQQRFVYVPFKANALEAIGAINPTDEGFALVCGRSDRDYLTLAAAVEGLDVPIAVLLPPDNAEVSDTLSGVVMPPNVRMYTHDGSVESWITWMSRARFVILPVLSDVLKPSGISTYLQAMALGKCVVMSDSPATDGLVDRGEAVLVRPGDPVALRNAISRVANDDQYRARVAAAGRAYAWSLGGEERLADDIAERVGALVDGASHEPRNE
jgi:hypothetical protein